MTAADAAVRTSLQHAADVACTHCQLPVPAGLIEPDAQDQFCCGGCRTAFAVLHDHGLDTYHDTPVGRDGPVAAESRARSFEEFDHATFHELYDDSRLDRTEALREMTVRYRDLMHSNEPVHDWPVG